MFGCKHVVVLAAILFFTTTVSAQQFPPPGGATSRIIYMNVVVTTESGQCVTDLQQQNFTIFDNDSMQAVTSFKAVRIGPRVAIPRLIDVADTRSIAGCFADGELFLYELSFHALNDDEPNRYHTIGVRVDRPNLIVQARQGYYTRPSK